MRARLTRDAERLVERHIDSAGLLDLLLLLRSRPDRAWTEQAICAELHCPPGWPEEQLRRLRSAGLAARDGDGHRYAPATPRLEAAADSLAGAWRRDRARTTSLILAPRRRPAAPFDR
jgi:DNA-binding IclR family transcriptional regulator